MCAIYTNIRRNGNGQECKKQLRAQGLTSDYYKTPENLGYLLTAIDVHVLDNY